MDKKSKDAPAEYIHNKRQRSENKENKEENKKKNNEIKEKVKKIVHQKPIKFTVIGGPGNGKSSLLNLIIGDEGKEYFKTSNSQDDCTTHHQIVKFGNITLCDFPGLNSTLNNDPQYIIDILGTLKNEKFNAVGVVYNIRNNRVSNDEKKFFEKFIPLITSEEFWRHVIIIFTNCDEEEVREEAQIIGPQIASKFFEMVKEKFPKITDSLQSFPCFYLSSKKWKRNNYLYDDDSLEEVKKIFELIGNFSPLEKENYVDKKIVDTKKYGPYTKYETNFTYKKVDKGFFGTLERGFMHLVSIPFLDIPSLFENKIEEIPKNHEGITKEFGYDYERVEKKYEIKYYSVYYLYSDGNWIKGNDEQISKILVN